MSEPRSEIEVKVEICLLQSFYGALLTNRQQDLLRLYFEEDLTLGEIAQNTGVSRQCVHNTLQRASHQLIFFESKLGLLAKFQQIHSLMETCVNSLSRIKATPETIIYLDTVNHVMSELFIKEEV